MLLHAVEAGAGITGTPVALLHGLFGSAMSMNRVQRVLAQSRRVLAFDMRNHGASPHEAGMDYHAMAGDVAESLAARDASPAVVIGHSMGGKAAMMTALMHPDSVARLLVSDIAPVPYPSHGAYRDYAAAMQKIVLRAGMSRADADAALAEVCLDATLRAFLLTNLRFGTEPHWRIGLDEIAGGMDQILDWQVPPGARYDGPVLFVAGELSHYIQPEHRAPIRALFPAARFVTIKGAGHWVHADAPDAFADVARGFAAG